MTANNQDQKTFALRGTKALEKPELALEKGWFQDRAFCESFFAELGDLRRSFIAPVPGLLGERIGPPEG